MTAADVGRREIEVGPDGAGERLDVFVAAALELSRTRVHKLIEEGRVLVDGRAAKKSEPLSEGQRLEVEVPAPTPLLLGAEDIPLDIVYQDESVVVVDKPAGMVVHPSAGHYHGGTLVNALLHHIKDLSGIGGTLRPGIVHRLDKGTSGLLVVAKNDFAHRALSDALKQRKVRRLYLAMAWGHLEESPLTVDAPIGRDPNNRKRMAVVEGGRRAVSRARRRERWRAADLLDVALETGRTHQIRVHLAYRGHPVVGDPLYGVGWEKGMSGKDSVWARELARRLTRPFLHSAELSFDHPVTGERMRFQSPLPPDLAEAASWARETTASAKGGGSPEGLS